MAQCRLPGAWVQAFPGIHPSGGLHRIYFCYQSKCWTQQAPCGENPSIHPDPGKLRSPLSKWMARSMAILAVSLRRSLVATKPFTRLFAGATLLGGLALSAVAGLAQGFPKPPAPPPPSSVVSAVQGAANQAVGAVTELTADQKQKVEEAKRQLEAKVKAAGEALKIRAAQRVSQLNTFYSDQRKARQASQKTLLSRKLIVKAKGPALATSERAPVAKTTGEPGLSVPLHATHRDHRLLHRIQLGDRRRGIA